MEDGQKSSWRKRLVCRYGSSSCCSALVILRGNREVTVYSCRKILLYTPCEIRLLAAGHPISIVGEDLFCTSFSGGTVTVRGRIFGVHYPDGSSEERRSIPCGEDKERKK